MFRNVGIAFAALLIAGCSTWRKEDTYREAGALTLMAIDYGQSLHIASNPDQWTELNPILGEHPSRAEVNRYFATAALLHVGVSAMLPTDKCFIGICDWRKAFQWVTIGVEAGVVAHNYSLGIRTDF